MIDGRDLAYTWITCPLSGLCLPPSGVTQSPTARLRALGGWVTTRGMGMTLGWAGLSACHGHCTFRDL